MKKLLTLTLSLLMAFSMCLTVSADNAYVAQVGECEDDSCKYTTLESAINAEATASGSTIKLLDNHTLTSDLSIGKDITIDLNGKKLTVNQRIIVNGKSLTVKDSGNGEGIVLSAINHHSNADGHIDVRNGGSFTLKSGKITSNCGYNAAAIVASGTRDINYPTIVSIQGGTIDSRESCISVYMKGTSVSVTEGSTLKSNGDIFKAVTTQYVTDSDLNEINVSGGTLNKEIPIACLADGYTTERDGDNYKVVPNNAGGNTSTDTSTTTTTTKSYDAKDKNQDGIITCDEEMDNPNWVWSDTKGACVYSVTNTSVR